jgi:hypothetical protein
MLRCVNSGEQVLARTKKDRRNRQMKLINKRRAKVLSNRFYASSDLDVVPLRGFGCAVQRRLNAVRNKMENRPAVHCDGWSGIVGKHEDRSVIRRVVAPPTLPSVVKPRSANRPKHVPAENPSSDIRESAGCKIIIDTRRTTIISNHPLKRSSSYEPLVQGPASHTERICQVLIGAGAVAIQRNGEVANPKFSHVGHILRLRPHILGWRTWRVNEEKQRAV